MSSERFLEKFGSLRKHFLDVHSRPDSEKVVADYQRIDGEFRRMQSDPECGDGEALIAKELGRAEQLELEHSELEMELRHLQSELAAAGPKPEPRPNSTSAADTAGASEELAQVQDQRGFTSYCGKLAELAGGLAVARTVFRGLLAKSVEDLREGRVAAADLRFAESPAWPQRREDLGRLLSEVQAAAELHQLPAPRREAGLLTDIDVLAAEVRQHLAGAAAARERRDAELAVFYSECDKLTLWCRQQVANLDAMQEPDHVQEYCRTLADNYATMSDNFAILVESVAAYVRDNHEPVRRALLAVDQVWFYVMVSTLERLSRTLFEIHPTSHLEDEVERYAPHPKHLAEALGALRALLQHHPDPSEEAQSVLAECELLSAEVRRVEASSVRQLRQFAARARASRNAYQCLRDAILSRVTYASMPADVVAESRRRQKEFEECVKELKAWASAQAHGESWRDIYSKIVEIKRVIEHEQEYLDERAGAQVN